MADTQTLFVSYSHKDEKHKDYVVDHLKVSEKQGLLKTWNDRQIEGGGDWRKEIESALADAKIAMLLVSHHSLTSDFILDEEVSAMLRRRDQEGLVVYPIIIRACDWGAVGWLKAMHLRPRDGKPLARFSLDRRDEVMAGISKEIRGFLDDNVEPTTSVKELAPSPVDDEIDRLAQQTEALCDELGATEAALNIMLELLVEQDVPAGQLETKLREIAERHVELSKRLHALSISNDEPEVSDRREQAAQAIEAGDYDQADQLLEEAETIDRKAIDEQESAMREQEEALNCRKLSVAATLGQRADLERTRLNYLRAAEHFAGAADLVPAIVSEKRLRYLMEQAKSLYHQGDEFGDNPALIQAIVIYRAIADEQSREREPLQWAATQNNLGTTLLTLGEREAGVEHLEEAVVALRQALEESTREHAPLDWAMTQNNLGAALWALGEREAEVNHLEEAVSAYRQALKERTRERTPLQWAMTQNNLGSVLGTLGEREAGTRRLKQAVSACRQALKEFKRGHAPLDWAMTQMNLGHALQILGKREADTKRLNQAILAYDQVLEVWTRERVPLDWALAQNNLGIALTTLGEQTADRDNLERAVSTIRLALEERKPERAPLDWARTQHDLGCALSALGKQECNKVRVAEAIGAYHLALETFERSKASHYVASTRKNLKIAKRLLKNIK